jgi:drug/metabolite transporter (DMT)-like permease
VAIVLALLSALTYGISDFGAGVASRRADAGIVSPILLVIGLLCAGAAVAIDPGVGPRGSALAWGAASGIGSGAGTLALYHGFAVGRITVVATLSAVVSAVVPAIVGLSTGDTVDVVTLVGIVIAIPAIALVSWHPDPDQRGEARVSLIFGLLAGLSFALLFIALDRAGTRSGAWPLIPGEIVGVLLLIPYALHTYRKVGLPARGDVPLLVAVGIIGGLAGLLFLLATGHGELTIVAVVTALYPSFTVLLARLLLGEHWTRTQAVGLGVAVAAVVLVSVG